MSSQELWFQSRLKYAMQTVITTMRTTKDQPTRAYAVRTALEVCHEIAPRRAELAPLHRAMLHGFIATIGYLGRHSPEAHAIEAISICDRIVMGDLEGDVVHAFKLSQEMGKILEMSSNEVESLEASDASGAGGAGDAVGVGDTGDAGNAGDAGDSGDVGDAGDQKDAGLSAAGTATTSASTETTAGLLGLGLGLGLGIS